MVSPARQAHDCPVQLQLAQRGRPGVRQFVQVEAEEIESARILDLQLMDRLEI